MADFRFDPGQKSPITSSNDAKVQTLIDAAESGKELDIYYPYKSASTSRRIRVAEVYLSQKYETVYVSAFCLKANALRTFKAEKIRFARESQASSEATRDRSPRKSSSKTSGSRGSKKRPLCVIDGCKNLAEIRGTKNGRKTYRPTCTSCRKKGLGGKTLATYSNRQPDALLREKEKAKQDLESDKMKRVGDTVKTFDAESGVRKLQSERDVGSKQVERKLPALSENESALLKRRIEELRPKLLDLTRRNPMINTKLSGRYNSYIRAIDELPEMLFVAVSNKKILYFDPLPPLESEPADERTQRFQRALSTAVNSDEEYLDDIKVAEEDSNDDQDNDFETLRAIAERKLRDRLRLSLGLPPRQTDESLSLGQHAKNHGIKPSFELPFPETDQQDERHLDNKLQTLMLARDLEAAANRLMQRCLSYQEETGLNVLHGAFGFLEWGIDDQEKYLSPLLLVSVEIHKSMRAGGPVYSIESTEDEAETNESLRQLLKLDHAVELPELEPSETLEDYFAKLQKKKPNKFAHWRVRRFVAFGVFPSSQLAMYEDLRTDENFKPNEALAKLLIGSGEGGDSHLSSAEEYDADSPDVEISVPHLVLDSDSSQFSALVDIAREKDIALEGPPGTGKSQTIVNAIAGAIAEGKKVLFVAEKMAALEVVRDRLDTLGLGEFLLTLQPNLSKRAMVVDSLRKRLDMPKIQGVPGLEREKREFYEVRNRLTDYTNILSSEFGATKLKVFDILSNAIFHSQSLSDYHRDGLEMIQSLVKEIEFNEITQDEISKVREICERAARRAENLVNLEPHWECVSRDGLDTFGIQEVLSSVETSAAKLRTVSDQIEAWSDKGLDISVEKLVDVKHFLEDIEPLSSIKGLDSEHLFQRRGQFLEGLSKYLGVQVALQLQPAEPSVERLRLLTQLQKSVEEFEMATLDRDSLSDLYTRHKGTLADLDLLKEKVKDFYDYAEDAGFLLQGFSFDSLTRAKRLCSDLHNSDYQLRSDFAALDGLEDLVNDLRTRVQVLREERTEISKLAILSSIPDLSRLEKTMAIIRRSNIFSVFDSKYRRAKNDYQEFSREIRFDKSLAIHQLGTIIDWKKSVQAFKDDSRYRQISRIMPLDLDADYEVLGRLTKFHTAVSRNFSGFALKGLRDFVLGADRELLFEIPEVENDSTLSFESVLTGIDESRREAEHLARSISALAEHEFIIEEYNLTEPNELESSINQLTSLLADIEELKQQDSLKEHFVGQSIELLTQQKSDLLELSRIIERNAELGSDLLQNLTLRAFSAVDGEALRREVGAAVTAYQSSLAVIVRTKSTLGLPENWGALETIHETVNFLNAAAIDQEGLEGFLAFNSVVAELVERGYGDVFDEIQKTDPSFATLPNVIEALIWRSIAYVVYKENSEDLRYFVSDNLTELREKMSGLDQKIIENASAEVRQKVLARARPPGGIGRGRKSDWTELSLIQNEVSKKKRHISVRKLIRRSRKALLELKPCWMMSPTAVAQYLPKITNLFDLVIIDEASQMPPQNALGAILRGNNSVIVGDTNQLPPSTFFKKHVEDETADEDEQVLEESILEMANSAFRPKRRLRWHYRSRHSALIAFSNRMMYDDDLILFPSAHESRPDMGVKHHQVEGNYKGGRNAKEAAVMVEAILKFMQSEPSKSLGVVAVNKQQTELIQSEVDFAVSRDPKAAKYIEYWRSEKKGLEKFFVKNLENVQGDERDVIFVGTVYGASQPGGQVFQRFGPIAGLAGRRRLNVLFSRAKQRIETFTSMTSADILVTGDRNPGSAMLKAWLQYSATGQLEGGRETYKEPDSAFEQYVIDSITALGFEAVPQVGVAGYFIDIGVRHQDYPHGFLLAVECDGASYHSSKSARDRDRLRQSVLEGLGWEIHRIWSTNWFQDPRSEVERLKTRLLQMLASKKSSLASSMVVETTHSELRSQTEETSESDDDRWEFEAVARTIDEVSAGEGQSIRGIQHPEMPANERADPGVEIGDIVEVRYLKTGDMRVFTVTADPNEVPRSGTEALTIESPLGQALEGHEVNEETSFMVDQRQQPIEILSIKKGGHE